MNTNTQVILVSKPDNTPTIDNFSIQLAPMPALAADSVICETLYLSLDPYMRSQIAGRHTSGAVSEGDVLRGETVSRVIESSAVEFNVGDVVRCFGGWQKFSMHKAEELSLVSNDIQPPSYALSSLGMPGLTAYAGLILKAKVKSGDVVLVPAATGAVGSVVGQLAKIHGCTVIGVAGSAEKCSYAIEELGYDNCINRRTEDLTDKLVEYCPDGVDVYFDLVGGEMLNTVSERLAFGARVVLCGLMAEYNKSTRSAGPSPGTWIISRASVFGLVVYDFEGERDAFIQQCLPYVKEGRLKVMEDIYDGLANAPEAFCRLMNGSNMGKVIVKI